MTRLKALLASCASASLLLHGAAWAQTVIEADVETTQRTSETGDLTVGGEATVSPADGDGVVIDSDNSATVNGTVSIEDRNEAVGVRVETGNTGDLVLNGRVSVTEDFDPGDTDDDDLVDGDFAQGRGRTGILISGAQTFTGNVTASAGSFISVEGKNSQGVRLEDAATLAGDLELSGTISVLGEDSTGVDVAGRVAGDVRTGSREGQSGISSLGEGAQAVRIAGEVEGGYENTATVANTGYRFTQRPSTFLRERLSAEDTRQGGAAIEINADVGRGVFFREVVEEIVDEEGNTSSVLVARSSVSQSGSAPAVLVDGQGTPIRIGVVAEITDPAADGFDPDLQFAFINQGELSANGVFDDVGATVFEARDVTFDGGILNSGSLQASSFRSGADGTEPDPGLDGVARVILLGENAIAERLSNSGLISASVTEDALSVFADREAIIPPRSVEVVTIDIDAAAELAELSNSGTITAIATAREGVSVVVRDASGTLSRITNTGQILALGVTSDSSGVETADINLVALDLQANTVGVRLRQDADADSVLVPGIFGDVFLGEGDDDIALGAGRLVGAVSFGGGADRLSLTGGSELDGQLTDADGTLAVTVEGSTLTARGGQPIGVSSASFDRASTFRPSIDGVAGTATTLVASGNVSFADGARVLPTIETIVGANNGLTRFAIASGTNVSVEGDLATLGEGFSPFLYDTNYSIDPQTGTLFVDLRLRDTAELGLDRVQAAAFGAAFDALTVNDALASALLNITNSEVFNAAYNQLLPEFGAAGRQFILANVDGAVGAVGSQLNASRNGQARPGGFWLEEFFYYADRERAGFSEQYRGQGFGFTGGIDTALGPLHAVGLNIGFATTEIEDTVGQDDPLSLETFQIGAYAGWETGGFAVDGYAGYGFNSFKSNRVIGIGDDFLEEVSGEWDGGHFNASLRASYLLPLGGTFFARPLVSVDYLNLSEDAYEEVGAAGVALSIDDRDVDTTAVTALLNLGAEFQGRRTWVRPVIRAGYRSENSSSVLTTGRFAGLATPFALTAEAFPDSGLILGVGVAAGSEYSSFGFDLDTDIRDGFIRTTGRVVVRVLF